MGTEMEPPSLPAPEAEAKEAREVADEAAEEPAEEMAAERAAAGDEDEVASSFGGSTVGGTARGRGRGGRPRKDPAEPPAPKRPRYNDTPFGELTITDLENACREVLTLKRQVAAKDEELASLKDLRAEKAALARQVKALQGDVERTEKQADKLQDQVHEKKQDENAKLDRIKRAIKQCFLHQMTYQAAFQEQLSNGGRELAAFIPNVTPEQVKALGCDVGAAKKKYTDGFFGEIVKRSQSNVKLTMSRSIVVKYVKTACELKVEGQYFIDKAKPDAPTPKAKARGKARGRADRKAGGEGPEPSPAAEDEAAEDEEDAGEAEAEAEAAPEAAAPASADNPAPLD
eukprot:SRR837773.10486.p1 GENE.SRR837773.10486~~SRR837773.10486.p1  ORF type:complete len:344 (-),score=145.05 SRR837773.10486:70-1101(-)